MNPEEYTNLNRLEGAENVVRGDCAHTAPAVQKNYDCEHKPGQS
jgi:hypothetical protein